MAEAAHLLPDQAPPEHQQPPEERPVRAHRSSGGPPSPPRSPVGGLARPAAPPSRWRTRAGRGTSRGGKWPAGHAPDSNFGPIGGRRRAKAVGKFGLNPCGPAGLPGSHSFRSVPRKRGLAGLPTSPPAPAPVPPAVLSEKLGLGNSCASSRCCRHRAMAEMWEGLGRRVLGQLATRVGVRGGEGRPRAVFILRPHFIPDILKRTRANKPALPPSPTDC